MITVHGQYFDGRTSRKRPASLSVYADGQIRLLANGDLRSLVVGDLDVRSRVGDTPRSIFLPDGGKFETPDNDAVDSALAQFRLGTGSRWLNRLEGHAGFIAMALAIGVGLAIPSLFYLVRYGIDMGTLPGASVLGVAMDSVWRAGFAPGVFSAPIVTLVCIVALAVLYPALKASLIRPVEAMRYH